MSKGMRGGLAAILAGALALGGAEVPPPLPLPAPRTEGGKPLLQALKLRATARAFAPDPLPEALLSDLLWAACGVNRPAEGKRTAPSARNWQEVDVYVVMARGAYRYDAPAHWLKSVVRGDHRAATGRQAFVAEAPLTLVLVADRARMTGVPADSVEAYAWADAAFIAQNISLFCASEGLATGVRASLDRAALAKALGLSPTQSISFALTVGFPRK